MTKRINMGICGPGGSGKTFVAASAFRSKYVSPDRILYIDNHGSTKMLNLPQYSKDTKYGVLHVPFDQTERLIIAKDGIKPIGERIYDAGRKGKPLYDLIIVDDVSEHELNEFSFLKKKFTGKDMRHVWDAHLNHMIDFFHYIDSAVSGANLVLISRVGLLPDPTTVPSGKREDSGSVVDDRPLMARPAMRGKIADWFLHFPDLIVWQRMEYSPKLHWIMQVRPRPTDNMFFKNRGYHYEEMPERIVNPTWDKFWEPLDKILNKEDEVEIQQFDIAGEIELEEQEEIAEFIGDEPDKEEQGEE